MALPSARTLQRLANETGYQSGTLEKALRLLDLLREIARDPILSERLALKGGTALNVFHLPLDRLSVDIDLNYIGALDRAEMEAERPVVDAAINRLLAARGYRVRRQPEEHAGGKWLAGGDAMLTPSVRSREHSAPSVYPIRDEGCSMKHRSIRYGRGTALAPSLAFMLLAGVAQVASERAAHALPPGPAGVGGRPLTGGG